MSGEDYVRILHSLGINPYSIQNRDNLRELDFEKDAYRPLINLIGRVQYWSESAEKYKKEIQNLDEKIAKTARLMFASGTDMTEGHKLKSSWLLLNVQKHQLEEEKYIPTKLAAAYILHVISNSNDKRDFAHFGNLEPSSYLDSVTFKDQSKQPSYFFSKEAGRVPLSKAWMLNHSSHEMAKEIFNQT